MTEIQAGLTRPPGQAVAVIALQAGLDAVLDPGETGSQLMHTGGSTESPVWAPEAVRVRTKLRTHPGDRFVVVTRINSEDPGFGTDTIGVLVETYATSELEAELLANHARAALQWAQGRRFIIPEETDEKRARPAIESHVLWWDEGTRPVEFNNPDVNKHTRFQFTGTLCVTLSGPAQKE